MTPRRKVAATIVIASSTVWLSAFAFGVLRPFGIGTVAAAPRTAGRAGVGLVLGHAIGPISYERGKSTKIVMRFSDTRDLPSRLSYVRLLEERFPSVDFDVFSPFERGRRLPAELSALKGLTEFTLVLDSVAEVGFIAPQAIPNEELRQLTERVVLGKVSTEFPQEEPTASEWEKKLRRADLRSGRDKQAASDLEFDGTDVIVVFVAHCSACRIRNDIRVIDNVKSAYPEARVAAVFPTHYLGGPARVAIDSLSVPVFVTDSVLDDRIAYVTRDKSAASPVVLSVRRGRVTKATRIDGFAPITKSVL